MAGLLERSRGERISVPRLLELAHAGDRGARRAVADAGAVVGQAVAAVVNVLNPELVVIGGELAGAGDVLLDPIRGAEVLCAAALVLPQAPQARARRLAAA